MGKFAKISASILKDQESRASMQDSTHSARMSLRTSVQNVEGAAEFLDMAELIRNKDIKKVMRAGGVKKINKPSYLEGKAQLMDFIAEVVSVAVIFMTSDGRKTIMKKDIDAALERRGMKIYG